nr:uncharacterized protein LOC117684547 [Crassostrea gigas]
MATQKIVEWLDSVRTYMKDRYDGDSASSDPYEDDNSEEGEIDDFTYKSPLSRTLEPKEADSDDELDAKRFDPLNDETEYLLDKSKANYAKKYFKLHLTEEKIRSCILEDAPIPGNEFLNPPEIDDYIEDLVADHKSMKFLKMHDSSLKFVQKRVAHCMGPVSRIWEDKAHKGHTSTMDIEDVVKLLEKTILMIGQVNVDIFPRQDSQEYKESEKHVTRQRGKTSGRHCTIWERFLCYPVPEVKRQKASPRDVKGYRQACNQET